MDPEDPEGFCAKKKRIIKLLVYQFYLFLMASLFRTNSNFLNSSPNTKPIDDQQARIARIEQSILLQTKNLEK